MAAARGAPAGLPFLALVGACIADKADQCLFEEHAPAPGAYSLLFASDLHGYSVELSGIPISDVHMLVDGRQLAIDYANIDGTRGNVIYAIGDLMQEVE